MCPLRCVTLAHPSVFFRLGEWCTSGWANGFLSNGDTTTPRTQAAYPAPPETHLHHPRGAASTSPSSRNTGRRGWSVCWLWGLWLGGRQGTRPPPGALAPGPRFMLSLYKPLIRPAPLRSPGRPSHDTHGPASTHRLGGHCPAGRGRKANCTQRTGTGAAPVM